MNIIFQFRNFSWVILVLSFFSTSCIKELEIDTKNVEKKVVVQCLFSEDQYWDILLLKTKNMADNMDTPVENAKVEVVKNSHQTILLNHTGNGHYQADQKPVAGETYQLKINIPGMEEISAESSIPVPVQANIEPFEVNWLTYIFPSDMFDRDVFPISIRFEEPLIDVPVIFRALVFNPNYGYKRYLLSPEALRKLEQQNIPKQAVSKLEKLLNKWQVTTDIFRDCFNGTANWAEEYEYYKLLRRELTEKTVNTRDYEAFYNTELFSNDGWTGNISIDSYTVLGIGNLVEKASLYYSDPNLKINMEREIFSGSDKREYWLEATQASNDYYEYYRTYILQLSQRINPYSEPVLVHSNIHNGVGIFAGFHRQTIHLLTYK